MSPHRQTYFELNPETRDEPSTVALIAGAIVGFVALWVSIVFLFTL